MVPAGVETRAERSLSGQGTGLVGSWTNGNRLVMNMPDRRGPVAAHGGESAKLSITFDKPCSASADRSDATVPPVTSCSATMSGERAAMASTCSRSCRRLPLTFQVRRRTEGGWSSGHRHDEAIPCEANESEWRAMWLPPSRSTESGEKSRRVFQYGSFRPVRVRRLITAKS